MQSRTIYKRIGIGCCMLHTMMRHHFGFRMREGMHEKWIDVNFTSTQAWANMFVSILARPICLKSKRLQQEHPAHHKKINNVRFHRTGEICGSCALCIYVIQPKSSLGIHRSTQHCSSPKPPPALLQEKMHEKGIAMNLTSTQAWANKCVSNPVWPICSVPKDCNKSTPHTIIRWTTSDFTAPVNYVAAVLRACDVIHPKSSFGEHRSAQHCSSPKPPPALLREGMHDKRIDMNLTSTQAWAKNACRQPSVANLFSSKSCNKSTKHTIIR